MQCHLFHAAIVFQHGTCGSIYDSANMCHLHRTFYSLACSNVSKCSTMFCLELYSHVYFSWHCVILTQNIRLRLCCFYNFMSQCKNQAETPGLNKKNLRSVPQCHCRFTQKKQIPFYRRKKWRFLWHLNHIKPISRHSRHLLTLQKTVNTPNYDTVYYWNIHYIIITKQMHHNTEIRSTTSALTWT